MRKSKADYLDCISDGQGKHLHIYFSGIQSLLIIFEILSIPDEKYINTLLLNNHSCFEVLVNVFKKVFFLWNCEKESLIEVFGIVTG